MGKEHEIRSRGDGLYASTTGEKAELLFGVYARKEPYLILEIEKTYQRLGVNNVANECLRE